MKKLSNIFIALLLLTSPFWADMLQNSQGTDDKALDLVSSIKPGYVPWIEKTGLPISDTLEPFMFSLQIAIGILIFTFFIYYLKKTSSLKNGAE